MSRTNSSNEQSLVAHLPPRHFHPMPAQPIIPWTPARLLRTAVEWIMEEQQLERPS